MHNVAAVQDSAQRGAMALDEIAAQRNNKVSTPDVPWPEDLTDKAYCGLAGEIVREIAPQTESDAAAILGQVLVAFGALVGRGPHIPVEGDQHHCNLFLLLVGQSSKARKGTSWGRVKEIFERVEGWPRVEHGLSSGEGLKFAVRDAITKQEKDDKTGFYKTIEIDAGIQDKRLLVYESEFAQVLRQAARAGNTLSATIRCAWDSGNLRTLTKNDPIAATGAHISIVGHITADELRADLTQTDTANGFANRFLFMCVKRSKSLPFGGVPLAHERVAEFAKRIAKAVGIAKSRSAMAMTDAAREVWKTVYPTLSVGHPGLFGSVTGRAEAQCLRLALSYALMDESPVIEVRHLMAALNVWERAEASARFIFGSALGDPVADEIYRSLRANPNGLTRTEISGLFHRNQPASRLGLAFDLLQRRKLAKREARLTDNGTAEVWVCE